MLTAIKKIARGVLGDANVYQINHWLGRQTGGFHDDRLNQKMIHELIRIFRPTAFAETGLFQGLTTRYMAVSYPQMAVHSFEVNETFYRDCLPKLSIYPNVHLHLGSSEKGLRKALSTGILGVRPLFYLDAHWYDYWPLQDEMLLISKHLKEAVIVIDDFQVPGRDDFVFGEGSHLEFLQKSFGKSHRYQAIFPNYQLEDCGARSLAGYLVLLQNPPEECVRELLQTDLVRRFFKEHPLAL